MTEKQLVNENVPLLKIAEKYWGGQPTIRPLVDYFYDFPDEFIALTEDLDKGVTLLNQYIGEKLPLDKKERECLSKCSEVKSLLNAAKLNRLPSLTDLEADTSFSNAKSMVRTFRKTEDLLSSKEWNFHENIEDNNQAAAALMLETYGKFIEQRWPELKGKGTQIMLALEEIFAIKASDTDFFRVVKNQGWYDVAEGFSPELVAYIESR